MKKTVLIIEDEQDMRDLLESALRETGLHVITAADGHEGLTLAAEHQPDLILLDLMLPQFSGHDVLKTIRSSQEAQPKVIVLSAMTDVTNVGDAYEEGVSDYIIKSETSPAEIVQKINAVLAQN